MWLQKCLLMLCFCPLSLGNVEKTIFVAPETIRIPRDMSIENLYQIPLNPNHWTVRTRLMSIFPNEEAPKGSESWFTLRSLTPGQRYEVRVCWLATQPTNFWLYTYTITNAFENPALLASMNAYAHQRSDELSSHYLNRLQDRAIPVAERTNEESLLFLQIYAAADYFSTNKTLMENVPPVHVDIILDPFLWNVFPKSLVPTAGYISSIAIFAWFVSTWVFKFLKQVAETSQEASSQEKEVRSTKKSQ